MAEIEKNRLVEIRVFPFGLGEKNDILPLNEITDGVSNTFNNIISLRDCVWNKIMKLNLIFFH